MPPEIEMMTTAEALALIQSIVVWIIGILTPIVTVLITGIVILWKRYNSSSDEAAKVIKEISDEYGVELKAILDQNEQRNVLLIETINKNAAEMAKVGSEIAQTRERVKDFELHVMNEIKDRQKDTVDTIKDLKDEIRRNQT